MKKNDPHRFCIFVITDSENVVREMSKKSRFRGCFDRNMVNLPKHCSNPTQYLYHIHWSLERELCSKKSLLLTSEILGLLVNTLATDKKYPVLNRDNLVIPTQMQLSYKQKNIFQFFAVFLKSRLKLEHLEQKYDPHSFCSSEIIDPENVVG